MEVIFADSYFRGLWMPEPIYLVLKLKTLRRHDAEFCMKHKEMMSVYRWRGLKINDLQGGRKCAGISHK